MSTKLILDQIKTDLLAYQNGTLSGIKTWKRGVLPPNPLFPALTIIPIREIHDNRMAGGDYDSNRDFEIQVYCKSKRMKDATDNAKAFGVAIVDIIKTDFHWQNLCIDSEVTGPNLGDPIELIDTNIAVSTVALTTTSRETLPTDRDATSNTRYTSKQIIDELRIVFQGYYDNPAGALDLSDIGAIHKSVFPTVAKFPALTISAPSMDNDRTFAGADTEVQNLQVGVWTKLMDKEVQLDSNLDIAEVVKQILQKRGKWGYLNTIDTIEYDIDQIAVGNVYHTQFNWMCRIFSAN